MKKFYVDFYGWVTIEAENEEQAEKKFWEEFTSRENPDCASDDNWEIVVIEEKTAENS